MSNEDIRRYTAEELHAMRDRGESLTDWARVDAMSEEELAAAIASDPDWKDEPPFSVNDAVWVTPGANPRIVLSLDPDVLDWFQAQGAGYRTHMNEALRAHMQAHRRDAAK